MAGKRINVDRVALEQFATELTRLRTKADLSQRSLGKLTRVSGQQVGAIERCQRSPSKEFAEMADEALGANGALLNLWPSGRSAPSRWLQKYVDLELKAQVIQQFQVQVVPALLQTEDYARATLEAAYPPNSSAKIAELLSSRLQRQKLLDKEAPPIVQYVVDEAALHRVIGGPDIMKAQFLHMLDVIAVRPFVTLQVLPFRRGARAALEGTFTLLGMTPVEYLAYGETAGRGNIYTEPEIVAVNMHRFGALRSFALDPDESAQMIRSLAEKEPS
ncbi:helix-turn-helix domain-containing protein [Nocardiopsis flavescens]